MATIPELRDDLSATSAEEQVLAPAERLGLGARLEQACSRGRAAAALYRLAARLHQWGIPALPFVVQQLNAFLHGAEVHYRARLGRGFSLVHPAGVVIGQNVVAGKNLKVYSGAVLGVKYTGLPKQPSLGDNVIIYSGAKVLGDITIGDNAVVGANAVVTRDVPPDTYVAGVPARVIRQPDDRPD